MIIWCYTISTSAPPHSPSKVDLKVSTFSPASQQMRLKRWGVRRFDLFTTGLLEDQPAAWPPLQGEGKANLLHWATVALFEELYERVSASKLLINRYVYSLETVHPKHLWVTAVCGSGCVWIITWEKTRHEKRAWGDECRWASLLPAVCPELPRS